MKRILTLIVTLVCVFAAYSQNTVYIWKDNTLSVQAADSITIDRSFGNWIDMGLGVFWKKQIETTYKAIQWREADKMYGSLSDGSRLPTISDFRELLHCSTHRSGDGVIYLTGITGNTIAFRTGYYWTDSPYVYYSTYNNLFLEDTSAYAHVLLVLE